MCAVPIAPLNVNTGINGTFYNIGSKDIYGIAMQDNKEICINSYVSNFDGVKRGCIWFDGQKMNIGRIYNVKEEIKGSIKWAISGLELYPSYSPTLEGFIGAYSDVLRKCNHTAIGYKDNKVYLMACENLYLKDFREKMLNSSIAFDGIINLDGGGSTQMNFNGKSIIKSTRKLNHAIVVI